MTGRTKTAHYKKRYKSYTKGTANYKKYHHKYKKAKRSRKSHNQWYNKIGNEAKYQAKKRYFDHGHLRMDRVSGDAGTLIKGGSKLYAQYRSGGMAGGFSNPTQKPSYNPSYRKPYTPYKPYKSYTYPYQKKTYSSKTYHSTPKWVKTNYY